MIGIRLAAVMAALAVLCAPAIALGQTPDSEPGELVEALFSAWGNWTVFTGIAIALGVHAWRLFKPQIWEQIPSKLRRVIPPTVAALTTVAASLVAGASWADAGKTFVSAWAGVLLTQDIVIALFGNGTGNIGSTTKKTISIGLVCLALPLALLGCQPPHSAADVERATVVGYAFAVEAIEASDNVAANWIESLDEPTEAELSAAERIADVLVEARRLLVVVRERLLEGEEVLDELRSVITKLSDSVRLLEASGVKIPDKIQSALNAAEELLGDPQ
jgi:hypothetical protein